MLLKATGPEVYVATMTTVIYNYYDSLVETLNYMKSLELKDYPGKNSADCYDKILVDVDILESDRAFNPQHLGYIIQIFEDTSDYIFHIWTTKKYKEVMEFIREICVYEKYVMQHADIITYGSLVQ